jgi:anti-sigma B factor antagonist
VRIITSVSVFVPFRIVESRNTDGVLRIALLGELDLAVADQLSLRLEQLRSDGIPVRLDLSRLEFIDSSGLRTLLKAMQRGRHNTERLVELDRMISHQVQRVIDIAGVAPVLWPTTESVKPPRA